MLRLMILTLVFTFFAASALIMLRPDNSMAYERPPQKTAIVLAAFGTTEPQALKNILNVEKKVIEAFPNHDVHLAFTSNIVRNKWKNQLANDKQFRKDNPDIQERFFHITNPLTTLALIQEDGSRNIIVQSLHITNGSEYAELKSIIDNLAKITALQESLVPFPQLLLGDSALSKGKKENIQLAADALAPLVKQAKGKEATLALMGHGNPDLPLTVYKDLEKLMSEQYKLPVVIGLVDGEPGFESMLKEMEKIEGKNVYLAPLMLVAGDHAINDMASDDPESLASLFKAKGYNVIIHLEGLGSLDAWADIYVNKIKELDKQLLK